MSSRSQKGYPDWKRIREIMREKGPSIRRRVSAFDEDHPDFSASCYPDESGSLLLMRFSFSPRDGKEVKGPEYIGGLLVLPDEKPDSLKIFIAELMLNEHVLARERSRTIRPNRRIFTYSIWPESVPILP